MPTAPWSHPAVRGERARTVCLAIVLLMIAAGTSQAATNGPSPRVTKTVGIGPQVQGLQVSWMDVELTVRPGERFAWDWEADMPLRFYIVSPTGAIMASVDDESSSEGSVMMTEAGRCKAAWCNPSFRTSVLVHLTVEVVASERTVAPSPVPRVEGGVWSGWQWVAEVAVALLLLLACEVAVAVPLLVIRARAGQGRARRFPIDYVDAYLLLGPEAPVGADGLPAGAPLQARPMEGALAVVRGSRR